MFLEYCDLIIKLKNEDVYFVCLFDKYNEID